MAQPKIQQLKTPGGITVWLVESHQIPMISTDISFRAGSMYDPANAEGLANFTASLLDEGSGKLDAQAFKEALDDIGARYSMGADTTDISVVFDTLTENRERAFELIGQSLQTPRFDDEAVQRVRAAIVAGLKRSEEDPGTIASRAFGKAVFASHPYAHASSGTPQSVEKLTGEQARAFWAANFNRANLVVSMVGDISPAEATRLVDIALAGLPAGTHKNADVAPPQNSISTKPVHLKKDIPQANVLLGHQGVSRQHPEYWNMLVLNELLGGGVLTSRLYKSVRREHGLAYSIGSANMPLPGSGEWLINFETGNATVQQALDLTRAEIERVRTTPVAQGEFDDVISYLVGSFPMRIDTNRKILGYLSMMQMEGLGPHYLTEWVAKIKAVRPENIQRAASQLLHPANMALVVVGSGPALKAH